MGATGTCNIDVRNDGVYLVISTPLGGDRVGRQDILKTIETAGVQEIDFNAINKALKDTSDEISVKISTVTEVKREDETIVIEFSKLIDEAYATFSPSGFQGKSLTKNDIITALTREKIQFGVHAHLIENLAVKKEYGMKYTIATGKAPNDGANGYLEFHFDTKPKTNRPKILTDGKVDFRQIDYVETCQKNQILITTVEQTMGEDGYNVLGDAITAKSGKPAPKIGKTKNTVLSDDGKKLTAGCSGQIIFKGNRVEIYPVLEVKGDVGPETGNIQFGGAVMIKGNLKAGYNINAEGDVEIHGAVEGSGIYTTGDIHILGGIQGMEKAIIQTTGSIFTRYAENATLISGGDIIADSVLHSKVKCGGSLKLEGKKCLLVGGNITVSNSIHTKTIGSPMATVTEISVGHTPEVLEDYNRLKTELEQLKHEYEKVDHTAAMLLKLKDKGGLSQDKKEMLLKAMHTKAYYRDKLQELQDKLGGLSVKLSSNAGTIYATQTIYCGTKVMIGNAVLYVRDDITACSLRNVDGKIIVGSSVSFG